MKKLLSILLLIASSVCAFAQTDAALTSNNNSEIRLKTTLQSRSAAFNDLVISSKASRESANAFTGTNSFLDGSLTVLNTSDPTKKISFSAASVTTATTRTFTFPDFNGRPLVSGGTNTLAGATTILPNANSLNLGSTTDAVAGSWYLGSVDIFGYNSGMSMNFNQGSGTSDGYWKIVNNNYRNGIVTGLQTVAVAASTDLGVGIYTGGASGDLNERLLFRDNGTIRLTVGSDATGDTWYRNSSGNVTRRAIGSTNDVLTVIGGVPTWQAPAVVGGTVTTVSVVSANGFAGSVATATTTPAITLTATPTGILKSNGTAISAATANTDYLTPAGGWQAATGATLSGANVITGTTSNTLRWVFDNLGAYSNPTDGTGLHVRNTTAATSGTQQYSPPLILEAQAWNTTATASQNVKFAQYVTGSSASTTNGVWTLRYAVNNGSYTTAASFNTATPVWTFATAAIVNGAFTVSSGGATITGSSSLTGNWTVSGNIIASQTTSRLTIGGATITSGSVLADFQSTTLGVLMPRVTTIASVLTPVASMIAYDAATDKFNFRQGASWVQLAGSGLSGSTGSVDKAMLIANGTGGSTVQSVPLTVTDNTNDVTFAAVGAATDISLILNVKGTSGSQIKFQDSNNSGLAIVTGSSRSLNFLGGDATIYGTGRASGGGTASSLTVAGGDGIGTNDSGGNLILRGGIKNGTGTPGTISLVNKAVLSDIIRLKNYTVSTLPAGTAGDAAFVTDALTPSFLVIVVGGGSVSTPVFYNGTNWVSF